jgi:hypothetical protein
MSDEPKPKPAAPPPPKAPAKAPPPAKPPAPAQPAPKTAAGRAALGQYRVGPDWDAIAAAAVKATGLEAELATLRDRHQRLTDAGHQVCDNISALFATLAKEPRV